MTAAAAAARRQDGADGLTLAARATLVEALYLAPAAARQVLVERAIDDARAALAQAPDHYGAHLQLALALGALAELEGPITAHLKGHAREGRELLERARQLAPPGDPWPDGLLGIWHLQLVRFGSAALAAELYGASAEEGLALCRRAAARAPAALALRYGCAASMLDLDPAGLGPEALAELAAIVALPAADAAERLVQGAARRRIAEVSGGGALRPQPGEISRRHRRRAAAAAAERPDAPAPHAIVARGAGAYSSARPGPTVNGAAMGGEYQAAYARAAEDPEGFWAEAAEALEWERRWDRVLDDARPPFYRWFAGGRLNTCHNAVDRHVAHGRGDQLAIIHDSPVTGHRPDAHLRRAAGPGRALRRRAARRRASATAIA